MSTNASNLCDFRLDIFVYKPRDGAAQKKINHVANDKAGKGQYKKFSRSYDI